MEMIAPASCVCCSYALFLYALCRADLGLYGSSSFIWIRAVYREIWPFVGGWNNTMPRGAGETKMDGWTKTPHTTEETPERGSWGVCRCGPNRHHVFMWFPPCKQLGDFILFFFEYFLFFFFVVSHIVWWGQTMSIYILSILCMRVFLIWWKEMDIQLIRWDVRIVSST